LKVGMICTLSSLPNFRSCNQIDLPACFPAHSQKKAFLQISCDLIDPNRNLICGMMLSSPKIRVGHAKKAISVPMGNVSLAIMSDTLECVYVAVPLRVDSSQTLSVG